MKYTLKCTCGERTEAATLNEAKKDALGHIQGEKAIEHVVTCTRPVGVIVFIANPEKHPHMMQYSAGA